MTFNVEITKRNSYVTKRNLFELKKNPFDFLESCHKKKKLIWFFDNVVKRNLKEKG